MNIQFRDRPEEASLVHAKTAIAETERQLKRIYR